MLGEYRVKNPALKELFDQAQYLLRQIRFRQFAHNLRHHNSLADRLANIAMDRKNDVDDDADMPSPSSSRAISRRVTCGDPAAARSRVKIPPRTKATKIFICPCGSRMS